MTVPSVAPADTRFAQLPFVDELRSAEGLSRRLGFAVRPHRIRVKPGSSAIVAWQREEPSSLGDFADHGFTAVMTSPDKLANAQRRAARHGQDLTIHEAADPRSAGASGAVLVSGGVLADPKIGKQVARTLDHLGGDIEIIGYNPARRLLLKHTPMDGAPEFVRISADSQRHLAEAAHRWQQRRLPSLPVEFIGGCETATRSPWWGIGDLRDHPDPNAADEVGVIIAELHRGDPTETNGRDWAADRDPINQVETAGRSLSRLLPEREADVDELIAELRPRIAATQTLREIHGDLSPDQVLLGRDECRIIDLDRSGRGPIGADLGRWIASCRTNAGLHALEQPFLDGYRSAGGEDTDLGAWTAWAMLVAALEPWRSCSTTWRDETMRIIDAAIDAIEDRPDGLEDRSGGLEDGTDGVEGGPDGMEGGPRNLDGGARVKGATV
ncbi:phosphotransferase family protein [Brevibacterium spongiae]|uniref:Aminoglycoside phosphotransferase family protein n=1 Tax=Brevibacterium spongiae TaxID=2909672 RepID=A0ABY5SNU9_9MICO|nr:aminoglycoside phosphotransferase family protein [Brevibacterium spongiae]UVI35576.1 aminoglycoside phosphotransferase family protein [Brevibacterium spongiae]